MPLSPTQTILNGTSITSSYLSLWLAKRSGLPTTQQMRIAHAYTTYGYLSGIGNVIPFAQALHETGHFTSARWLQSNNPAGLGADDTGAWGGIFATPEAGIFAQFCHLLCYGTKPGNPLHDGLARLSPRHDAMVKAYGRGSAPRWVDLSGRWNSPSTPFTGTHPQSYGMKVLALADAVMRA